MQSKRMSLVEALANLIVGYLGSVAIFHLVLPLFGIYPSVGQSFSVVFIFAVWGVVKSYGIRRFFNFLYIKYYNNLALNEVL